MDLNHTEQSHGGAYVPVAILPRSSDILLAKMEARLPLDIFEEVGCSSASQQHIITCRHCCFQRAEAAVASCGSNRQRAAWHYKHCCCCWVLLKATN
jgi:hypothetical protein